MLGADFGSISPLDHRYRVANPELFDALSAYLSENATVRYQAKVEAALARGLARRGLCTAAQADQIAAAAERVTSEEVFEEERVTRHNIRALVNAIRNRVDEEARPYVHLTATSADIMDTARALQLRAATRAVVLPLLWELWQVWEGIARREAATLQIGRTHGQHAVPITFGFAVAEYVARLGGRIELVHRTSEALRGKMAGAVGAYNATSLLFEDAEAFEREVLEELGLEPGSIATQIVEPEYLTDYLHALVSTLGVLANFADDIRHLQRTEIAEVGEAFEEGQVGSSTMPHKRNPWNFEHVKSLWKVFTPRMLTVYMDQISEHQRDLTNSASGRFTVEIVYGVCIAADRLLKVSRKLVVDRDRMRANLNATKDMVVAEPLYILLAHAGHPDAHEAVRVLTLEAERRRVGLPQVLAENQEIRPWLEKLDERQRSFLLDPATYTGAATRKAIAVCDAWRSRLESLRIADLGTALEEG